MVKKGGAYYTPPPKPPSPLPLPLPLPLPQPTELQLKHNEILSLLSFIDTQNYQDAEAKFDEIMASLRVLLGLPEVEDGDIVDIDDDELNNFTLDQIKTAVNDVKQMIQSQSGGKRRRIRRRIRIKKGGDIGPPTPQPFPDPDTDTDSDTDSESDLDLETYSEPDLDVIKDRALQYLHDNSGAGNYIPLLRERLGLEPAEDVYPQELYDIDLQEVIQAVNGVLAQINPNVQPFIVGGRRKIKGSAKTRKSKAGKSRRTKTSKSKASRSRRTKTRSRKFKPHKSKRTKVRR